MRKIAFVGLLVIMGMGVKAQLGAQSLDSVRNYNTRYTTNSAITWFSNLRGQTLLRGIIDHIDSTTQNTVVNFYKDGDSIRLVFASGDTLSVLGGSGGGSSLTNASTTGDTLIVGSSIKRLGVGTSGTDLALATTSSKITINIPNASLAATRGLVVNTDWQSIPGSVNLMRYGADNTGSTSIHTQINAAIAAGYKTIYLPEGQFLITTQINWADSVSLVGAGRGKTYIKMTSNITAIKLSYALGGNKAQFRDFTIRGTNGSGGSTSQKGIVIDSAYGCIIDNVGGYFMAGAVFSIAGNGSIASGNKYTFGNLITNCYTETCYIGLFLDVRAEYNRVTNNTFVDGTYGIQRKGGNNQIIGNNLSSNSIGYLSEGGSNNAHGINANNTMNHCGTWGYHATGITLGEDMEGNQIWSSQVRIENSVNINMRGGTIESDSIIITGSSFNMAYTRLSGGVASETGWRYSTSTGNIAWFSADGMRYKNLASTSNKGGTVNAYLNGVVAYGGDLVSGTMAGVAEHRFYQPITGANGTFDASRDLNIKSMRQDGDATGPVDAAQFYRTGTTGSTLAILDNAANYSFRVLPVGRIGVGGVSVPTAQMHFAASTTSASTAPIKFSTGTLMTTAEAGAFEYDGSHFYLSPSTTRKKIPLFTSATAATGSILYGNGTDFSLLAAGSDGHVLTLASGVPSWAAPTGGNAIATNGNSTLTANSTLSNSTFNFTISNSSTGRFKLNGIKSDDPVRGLGMAADSSVVGYTIQTREEVEINTSGNTPTTVFTLTPDVGVEEIITIVITFNAKKQSATGGYVAIKKMSFQWDGITTLTNGTLADMVAEQFFSGLSTCDITITNSGDDIIVQFTGESATDIHGTLYVDITRTSIGL